jgi:uncharacterized protein (DUF2336 family)
MKTAISIPDDTFEQVERRAKELGLNRSQFFARAAQRYLAELERESITAQINAALGDGNGIDEDTAAVLAYNKRRLAATDDDW